MTRVAGKKPVSHAIASVRTGFVYAARCRCGWSAWFFRQAAVDRAASEHFEAVGV